MHIADQLYSLSLSMHGSDMVISRDGAIDSIDDMIAILDHEKERIETE